MEGPFPTRRHAPYNSPLAFISLLDIECHQLKSALFLTGRSTPDAYHPQWMDWLCLFVFDLLVQQNRPVNFAIWMTNRLNRLLFNSERSGELMMNISHSVAGCVAHRPCACTWPGQQHMMSNELYNSVCTCMPRRVGTNNNTRRETL
jgi:hypothetical protein